jgi:hypothetical protein
MPEKIQKPDAWSPGLNSEIPSRLLPLVTLYRPENSEVDHAAAKEAAEFCGLKPHEMVAFKVSRLIVHELLIRVTADLFVPDGPSYEELGLNMRSMAARILSKHIQPEMPALEQKFADLKAEVRQEIGAILDRDIYNRQTGSTAAENKGFLAKLFGRKAEVSETELPEILALADWKASVAASKDPLETACLKGLLTVVGSMVGQRGRLFADKDMVCRFATNMVCNNYGSEKVGEWIEPMIAKAAKAEGYRFLPYQDSPFFMNVKGASAAGKSTIRPLQRRLAEKLDINWEDFALISPDYWRKFLLDYDSLGDDYKYAAMLTGQELEIIDKKLDRYMGEKAASGKMPHLLIDRFRFDSFTPSSDQQAESTLLSRFGDTVYLFFIITPPSETVERAWKRGIDTGRYKAVDDLLYHNIEAYTGLPQLFFSWVTTKRQKIHFEFLDNSVPYGKLPRTVAFGWNDKITILDKDFMRNINRYQNVNIEARRPEDVLVDAKDKGGDFVADCIEIIPNVTIADGKTLEVQGQTLDGRWVYRKKGALDEATLTAGSDADAAKSEVQVEAETVDFVQEKKFTVGAWESNGG